MDRSFEIITSLQYQLKAAQALIRAFQSGKKYLDMEEEHSREVRALRMEIKKLKAQLAQALRDMARAREHWFEVFEDLEKEHKKELEQSRKETREMEKRALKAEGQRDEALSKVTEQRREIYRMGAELEEEKGKNKRLTAQLNRDYENSSIPSSLSKKRKKVSNSREKTGRKPGGQPGHKGHCRRRQEVTAEPILLDPPREVLEDPDFKKTGKTIKKQLVDIRVLLDVKEYHADVYYNSKTGERKHAAFPAGVTDDVNYGGSVRAFLFLLNNDCHTSIDKSRKFLSDLTGGKLNISKGMVNRLSREFAGKTKKERGEAFSRLLLCPVMHADCTNAKVNGKHAYVYVCAAPDGEVLYQAREKKGHEGVKGTPVEDYQGTLVHDHDTTFYNYGGEHQECLAHILRYLKGSMENEPERRWNRRMHELVREMIHERNTSGEAGCSREKAAEYREKYLEILKGAGKEYEEIPAGDYYREGYNLFLRMEKYASSHLLFLEDPRVPATNNEAERLLRGYKRKQQQAVTFRSMESLDLLCQCMSMLVMMRRNEEENLFERVAQIFDR